MELTINQLGSYRKVVQLIAMLTDNSLVTESLIGCIQVDLECSQIDYFGVLRFLNLDSRYVMTGNFITFNNNLMIQIINTGCQLA